ncbi:MAG: restriction endonuclease [Candidatus Kaiserbacteria bacterium]|nr:MAG: restriction endonuclease [Candidatus Kaiserbacteria bacterium]
MVRKKLSPWLETSIEYASQRSYLDDLFHVYPTIPEGIRDIDSGLWKDVEKAFEKRDNVELLENLLKLELFPIKDSYVAYLKRDKGALKRNPATADRLAGRLYEMGLDEIFSRSSEPKETNRQIGPLFKRWLRNKSLGVEPLRLEAFLSAKGNAVLDGSDAEMMTFAREHLNYKHNKGLDFIGRFNGKYVIGEAKFLTDFGGHQNAQFNDAVATVKARGVKAITVAILDGVLYIRGKNKMFKDVTGRLRDENIMSALVLREFLYQI